MYKSVVDARGVPVGTVINMTQNGSGNFDIFGVQVTKDASVRINHGRVAPDGPIFLEVDLIETVDQVVKLKKRVEDLLVEVAH